MKKREIKFWPWWLGYSIFTLLVLLMYFIDFSSFLFFGIGLLATIVIFELFRCKQNYKISKKEIIIVNFNALGIESEKKKIPIDTIIDINISRNLFSRMLGDVVSKKLIKIFNRGYISPRPPIFLGGTGSLEIMYIQDDEEKKTQIKDIENPELLAEYILDK